MGTVERRSKMIVQNKKQISGRSFSRKSQKEIQMENSIIPSWAMDDYRKISKEFDDNFKRINRRKENV
ncbi:MAG: hypothetical protein ACLGHN_08155 [Bacteriovoracia bacterium]